MDMYSIVSILNIDKSAERKKQAEESLANAKDFLDNHCIETKH